MKSSHSDALVLLRELIGGDQEKLGRLGAALWARLGRTLSLNECEWAGFLGGKDAIDLVLATLIEGKALCGSPPILHASPLACVLSQLCEQIQESAGSATTPTVVWTLPHRHRDRAILGQTYLQAIKQVMDAAKYELLIVSPYVEAQGVALLTPNLGAAMARGVQITLISHDITNISTEASRAVEILRRHAHSFQEKLHVYSAEVSAGKERENLPLLHAKLFIGDREKLLLGSANITNHALRNNFESGVLLTGQIASETANVVMQLIKDRFVDLVF